MQANALKESYDIVYTVIVSLPAVNNKKHSVDKHNYKLLLWKPAGGFSD